MYKMAASVQVLCPNGRRQTVKVTPNTKLLQILEEVCHGQGFIPPEDFKLVQGRKELDLSLSFRFSSLPNNAKLELAKSTTARVEQNVTIALQLDSGQRLQDTFQPSISLWDLLLHFETQHRDHHGKLTKTETNQDKSFHPVCIFMREEVIGEQALKATTLKKLALTSGKAIIRLLHRPVEEEKMADICGQVEKEQAKQARLLEIGHKKAASMEQEERQDTFKAAMSQQLSNVAEEEEDKSSDSTIQSLPQQPNQQEQEAMDVDGDKDTLSSASFSAESSSKQRSPQTRASAPRSQPNQTQGAANPIEELRSLNIPGVDIFTPDDFHDLSPAEQAIAQRLAQRFLPHLQNNQANAGTSLSSASRSGSDLSGGSQVDLAFRDFKFPEETKDDDLTSSGNSFSGSQNQNPKPCERNTIVYNASEALPSASSSRQLPDDFFEVTQSDVRLMYQDLQNAVRQLDDQPLMTKAMRQSRAEVAYQCYSRVVLRVHFPDRLVLQACFTPRETVNTLHDFVRDCLEDKKLKFYLYTTPPKSVLKDMNSSLAMNHLAPAALVYFGCQEERDHYIKQSLLATAMTSRLAAETAVAEVLQQGDMDSSFPIPASTSSQDEAGPSGLSSSRPPHSTTRASSTAAPRTLPSGATVPKWLKLGKN